MWTRTESFQKLLAEGRWKVEFFSGEADHALQSKYPLVRLGDIVQESQKAIDPQREPKRNFNYIGLENVQSGTGDLVGFQPRSGAEVLSRSKVFGEGNVLYGRLRPYLNKVYLAEGTASEGICSGEFFVLVPDRSRVLPRVLRYILSSAYVADHIAKFQSGAALPRVPIKDLLNVKIPIPPIEHQRVIDKSLESADRRRAKLTSELNALPQTTMNLLVESLQQGKPLVMN